MAADNDSLLDGLIALAQHGAEIDIAVQVDGHWISGTLTSAAMYRAELVKLIGRELPVGESDDPDDWYLHLRKASTPGNQGLYRCLRSAVGGFMVADRTVTFG